MLVVDTARGPRAPGPFVLAGVAFACIWAPVGCGGNDVPIGGAHGGSMSAFVEPTAGNLSTAGDADLGSDDAALGAIDATFTGDAASGDAQAGAGGPSWTTIYGAYMTTCKTCHTQMTSARNGYLWLRSQGYITGAAPALVSASESCLVWYGGNMPPGGTANPQAVSDMNAWAAAGALDD